MFSKDALDQLAKWGLTAADADKAGIFEVEDASEIYPDFDTAPALVLPYYNIDGQLMQFTRDAEDRSFCRIRYLNAKAATGFSHKKAQRYSQPAKSGTHAYFGPDIEWSRIARDIQEPLIITEGEAKALRGIKDGLPVIALGGVYNFTNGGEELMEELEQFKYQGRDVYICFDSDALTNPNILAAEARLVDELQRKRGARCFLVRLPQDGDKKVGLDDFLEEMGFDAFVGLLQSAPFLGALDAKVVSLNQSVAWIEQEGMVWDMEEAGWIRKGDFVSGSRFSALKHITVAGKQRSEPKKISVANEWLTHPHAQRFGQILFRPGEDRVVSSDQGRPALNIWTGWRNAGRSGDVKPFLDLTAFLFQNMEEQHRDLPIQLMAYKVQNPAYKIPLALVLLGPQGCGKTMWSEILRKAMQPYSVTINPSGLNSQFQGWMERSLLVCINEAKGEDIEIASEELKGLISDESRDMNEKFRAARQIRTYFQFIITSNRRAVGSFNSDDRRMIVVNCPPALEPAFYQEYMVPWIAAGGPAKVLGYLLTLDLKGWQPPAKAPITAEKHLAYIEGLSTIQALAEDMRTSNESTIKLWLDQAAAWAQVTLLGSNTSYHTAAQATMDGIKQLQVRPWYQPGELAMLFPNICAMMGSKFDKTTPTGKLSRELRDAGVPYLVCSDDPRGFFWKGNFRQFLVVSDFDEWKEPLSQAEFERLMGQWPTWGGLHNRARAQ